MDKITENIADYLVKAFEDCTSAINEFMETRSKVLEGIRKEMALQITGRMLHYAEKYTDATFVTRWYWKRKLAKMAKATEEIRKMFEESEENKNSV